MESEWEGMHANDLNISFEEGNQNGEVVWADL